MQIEEIEEIEEEREQEIVDENTPINANNLIVNPYPVNPPDFIIDSLPKNFQLLILTSFSLSTSRFLNTLNSYTNTYYFSTVDDLHLAASSLISTTQSLILATGGATLNAISLELSKSLAKKDFDSFSHIVQQGWLLAGVLSVPMVGLFLASRPILETLGQSEQFTEIVQNYFFFYAAATPAFMLLTVNQQAALACGYPSMMLVTNLFLTSLTFLINAGVDFQLFNLILTEKTVGMSSAIANWMTLFVSFPYLAAIVRKKQYPFPIHANPKEILKGIITICKTGLPISVSVGSEFISTMSLMLMINRFGKETLAAAGINLLYANMALFPLLGLSQADSILIRKCSAIFHPKFVRRYAAMTATLASFTAGIGCILFATIPSQLSYPFTSDEKNQTEIDDIASDLFLINGIALIFDSIRVTCGGIIAGHGDTWSPMLINITCMLLLLLPIAYFENEINIIFATRAIMLATATSILAPRAGLYSCRDLIFSRANQLPSDNHRATQSSDQNCAVRLGKYTMQKLSRFCLISPPSMPAVKNNSHSQNVQIIDDEKENLALR